VHNLRVEKNNGVSKIFNNIWYIQFTNKISIFLNVCIANEIVYVMRSAPKKAVKEN